MMYVVLVVNAPVDALPVSATVPRDVIVTPVVLLTFQRSVEDEPEPTELGVA
jgi:hypothetical protein